MAVHSLGGHLYVRGFVAAQVTYRTSSYHVGTDGDGASAVGDDDTVEVKRGPVVGREPTITAGFVEVCDYTGDHQAASGPRPTMLTISSAVRADSRPLLV